MADEITGTPVDVALVEAAEAESEEAQARAEAAQARAEAATVRAKAARLRLELARTGAPLGGGPTAELQTDEVQPDDDDDDDGPDAAAKPAPRRIGLPRGRTVAVVAVSLVLAALLAANGFLAWHHYGAKQDRERAAQFAAAARQGVVNMTTLDFNKADADVARVLDSATGEFRTDFASRVDDFTSVVRDSKVVSTGTVNATAVESMTEDSAVVLVAASSTVTNAGGTKEEPRKWRLSVTVTTDGDQLKMSKVEFVP